jgi:hypothetical protein
LKNRKSFKFVEDCSYILEDSKEVNCLLTTVLSLSSTCQQAERTIPLEMNIFEDNQTVGT